MNGPTDCKGLLGRIFGHKFHRTVWGTTYSNRGRWCYRCGQQFRG